MRKTLTSILVLLWTSIAFAQIAEPVKWTSHAEKISDTEYDLVFKATIEKGWHLYSQYNPELASLPIEFDSDQKDDLFTFEGKAKESPTETSFTKTWGKDEIYFSHTAMLKQRIKLKKEDVKEVIVSVYGQACKESCVQLEKTFTFDLANASTDIEPMPKAVAHTSEKDKKNKDTNDAGESEKDKSLWIIFFLAMGGGFLAILTPCVFPLIPMTVSFFMKKSDDKSQGIKNGLVFGASIIAIYVALGTFISAIFGADAMNEFSTGAFFNILFFVILVVFAASFLGAFELMLPSSWGTKIDAQVDKKGGYIGIFFMALALAVVSFSCTMPVVGSALAASASAGGIGPVISMFGFSLALALPFVLFAMFPSWLNALPQSGGWLNTVKVVLGFLELAFAFKFLSNADLVYDLHLFEREAFLVIWIAIAFTLTLYLFGLITLPHDDENSDISLGRKLLGGFTMLITVYLIPGLWGAPLKLISGFPPPLKYAESPYGVNTDSFFAQELLARNILIGILVVAAIFGFLYLYKMLLSKNGKRMTVNRLFLGLTVLSIAIYLAPGLWGAPVKGLNFFTPASMELKTVEKSHKDLPEHAHLGPHDIVSFEDYDTGMAYAKKINKPVLIDFTGKACVNCRKMEDYVWGESKVLNVLDKDIVLISLYVDSRKKLPKEEQYVSEHTGKKIRTVGNKWSEMQTVKYKNNTQPYYVILNHDETQLTSKAYTYDADVDNFYNWLKEGTSGEY